MKQRRKNIQFFCKNKGNMKSEKKYQRMFINIDGSSSRFCINGSEGLSVNMTSTPSEYALELKKAYRSSCNSPK